MPIFGIGRWTRFAFAKNAITVAGDQIVSPFAKTPREQAQKSCPYPPSAAQLIEHFRGSIISGEKALARLVQVEHQIKSVQIIWIAVVPPKYIASKIALQGSKAEAVLLVVLQDELHHTIAQSADAVVENDRVW